MLHLTKQHQISAAMECNLPACITLGLMFSAVFRATQHPQLRAGGGADIASGRSSMYCSVYLYLIMLFPVPPPPIYFPQ